MPSKIAGDLGLMDLGRLIRHTNDEGVVSEGTLGYIAFDINAERGEQVRISLDTDDWYPNDMVWLNVDPFTKLEIVEPEDEDYVDEHHPSNPSALGWT